MKVCVTVSEGRVSSLFETGRELLIVELEGGRERCRRSVSLSGLSPTCRIRRVVDAGSDVLICGGIQCSQIEVLHAAGVGVVDQARGDVDQALARYRAGTAAR